MRQLVLTGLGNEVDLKSGRSVYTAIFDGGIRIEISEADTKKLTQYIYSAESNGTSRDYDAPPPQEEDEPDQEEPVLEDAPESVYESDTGVEQV
jgi:hypothetical protein